MRHSFVLLCLSLVLLVVPPVVADDFEFEKVNGTYTRPTTDMVPVSKGPMTVRLRSPRNTLRLLGHQLSLEPSFDGTHKARLWARFEGNGDLVADLSIGTLTQEMADRVELPVQNLEVEARIRMRRSERTDQEGYLVELVEIEQDDVEVRIRSNLAKGIVSTCRQFALLTLGSGACDGIEDGMSQATIPLPEEGETFLLPDALLTSEDRIRLESYLRRASR